MDKTEIYKDGELALLWCHDNNCCHYDRDDDKCMRASNATGKLSICWMDPSEGEY